MENISEIIPIDPSTIELSKGIMKHVCFKFIYVYMRLLARKIDQRQVNCISISIILQHILKQRILRSLCFSPFHEDDKAKSKLTNRQGNDPVRMEEFP